MGIETYKRYLRGSIYIASAKGGLGRRGGVKDKGDRRKGFALRGDLPAEEGREKRLRKGVKGVTRDP